jgi:outer membrane protein assembly factor BamD (BamD/ComL family)
MKRLILAGIALMLLAGCTQDNSKELYDTAQLEEKQHNQAHAVQLYNEIQTKYPKSPYAKQAKERLDQLAKEAPAK